jgi:hypothetical protein
LPSQLEVQLSLAILEYYYSSSSTQRGDSERGEERRGREERGRKRRRERKVRLAVYYF